MRYQELLEGLSTILYHATGLQNIGKILADNTLRLTPDIGTSAEQSHRPKENQVYYISFSRSKMGEYHYNKSSNGQTVIVLDGKKLMSDGFTGKPVEYWGWHKEVKDKDGKTYKTAPATDEMEDRIFSDKPFIPNASKYINEIHVLLDTTPKFRDPSPMILMMNPKATKEEIHRDTKRDDIFIRLVRTIYRQASQLGINFYVYNNEKNFKLLNKSHAIKISELIPSQPKNKHKEISFRRHNPFAELMELLAVDNEEHLSNKAKKKLYNMGGWYKDDTIRSIAADVHNSRTDYARPKLDALISEMKKLNLFNVNDLVNYIIEKFKD